MWKWIVVLIGLWLLDVAGLWDRVVDWVLPAEPVRLQRALLGITCGLAYAIYTLSRAVDKMANDLYDIKDRIRHLPEPFPDDD